MNTPTLRRTVLLALAALAPGSAGAAAVGAPTRIVSLNPCLDEILVRLADRSQIAALSHYARDPQGSTISAEAKTFGETFETAEEVVMLRPGLVLASRHTALATRNALRRLGAPVELFAVPNSLSENLSQITRIATLVGHADRGQALVTAINRALLAAAPPKGARPITAVVFQARGLAAGEGTLMNEMLERTGFTNVAGRYGVRQWGVVSLERLIADPPELLLSAEVSPGAPTWAERMISHPALRHLSARLHRAVLPERLLYCGGPNLIETAALLSAARQRQETPA